MDDWNLLQQFVKESSRPAMDQLVRRHVDMVYAVARREVANDDLAADVTQAVFIVLMRRASQIGPKVVLAGWLFKVTRFAAADARKSQARRFRHEREAAKMKSEITPETASPVDPKMIPLLNDAIASLPRNYRDAVVMKFLQDKSHGEVAQAQRISENACRQRLFRAMNKLRVKLGAKSGATIDAGTLEASLAAMLVPSTPPAVYLALHSSLYSAAAQSSAATLAIQTLRSMFMYNVKAMAALCGAILLVLILGQSLRSVMAQQSIPSAAEAPSVPQPLAAPGAPASQPAGFKSFSTLVLIPLAVPGVPASQPAAVSTSQFGPAQTPKGTVQAAFLAACANDEAGFLSCFDQPNEADQQTLKVLVNLMSATTELRNSVAQKFGAQAADQFFANVAGVNAGNLANADEAITGNLATVDIHVGPGKIELVKIREAWKISPAVLVTLNRESVEAQNRLVPVMRAIAKEVTDGKITTIQELSRALSSRLRPESGR